MTPATTKMNSFSTPSRPKRKEGGLQPTSCVKSAKKSSRKVSMHSMTSPKSCRKQPRSMYKAPATPQLAQRSLNISLNTPSISKTASKRCKTSSTRHANSAIRSTTTTRRKRSTTPATTTGGGDRFIPNRFNMNLDLCRNALFRENAKQDVAPTPKDDTSQVEREYRRRMMSAMCNVSLDSLDENAQQQSMMSFSLDESFSHDTSMTLDGTPMPQKNDRHPSRQDILNVMNEFDAPKPQDKRVHNRIKATMKRNQRMQSALNNLDAPGILDDVNVNLIDWSDNNNVVAIALQDKVYVYNYETKDSDIVGGEGDGEDSLSGALVTALKWCQIPGHEHVLVVATDKVVSIWDTMSQRMLRAAKLDSPVESLAFNQSWLSAGCVNGRILNCDLRASRSPVVEYRGHRGRVCSLKWNQGGRELASGGGDNTVVAEPRMKFKAHTKAVKALDWCPFSSHLLASGGFQGDNTIKVWNASTGGVMSSTKIASCATSLVWSTQSQHAGEFLTGHTCGSLALWKYEAIGRSTRALEGDAVSCLHEWHGHGDHVMGLALNSSGVVASLSLDESLKFWKVFDAGLPRPRRSVLLPSLSTFHVQR